MKKLFFLTLSLLVSTGAFAKIQQVSEDSLADDLNFKLEESSDSERQVASDEDENEKESEDSERDVASENEDLSAPIKYWKY